MSWSASRISATRVASARQQKLQPVLLHLLAGTFANAVQPRLDLADRNHMRSLGRFDANVQSGRRSERRIGETMFPKLGQRNHSGFKQTAGSDLHGVRDSFRISEGYGARSGGGHDPSIGEDKANLLTFFHRPPLVPSIEFPLGSVR
jgi:hypothetical protein